MKQQKRINFSIILIHYFKYPQVPSTRTLHINARTQKGENQENGDQQTIVFSWLSNQFILGRKQEGASRKTQNQKECCTCYFSFSFSHAGFLNLCSQQHNFLFAGIIVQYSQSKMSGIISSNVDCLSIKRDKRIIEVCKYTSQIHPIHSRTNSLIHSVQKSKTRSYQLFSTGQKSDPKCQIKMDFRTQIQEEQYEERRKKIYLQTLEQLKKTKNNKDLQHKTLPSKDTHSSHSIQNNSQQEDTIHTINKGQKDRANTALSQFKRSGGGKLKKKIKDTQKDSHTDNCSQSSFQYLHNIAPGPGCYEETKNKVHKPAVFSKSKRFEKIRPLTALAGFYNSIQIKKQVNNRLENVSFGTSKKNPRSEVKKVQFCEWNRPYFYQQLEDMTSKGRSQQFCLYFSQQRFKQEKSGYYGPDFYQKKQRNDETENMPSYYFRSSIPKNGVQIDNDQKYKFMQPQVKIQPKKQARDIKKVGRMQMKKNCFAKIERNEEEKGFIEQMSLENIKNSLQNRRRKLDFKELNQRKQLYYGAQRQVVASKDKNPSIEYVR